MGEVSVHVARMTTRRTGRAQANRTERAWRQVRHYVTRHVNRSGLNSRHLGYFTDNLVDCTVVSSETDEYHQDTRAFFFSISKTGSRERMRERPHFYVDYCGQRER